MSFGDNQGSPVGKVFSAVVNRFDAVLGPAFSDRSNPVKAPPAPAPSLLTSPQSETAPVKTKSLLGA